MSHAFRGCAAVLRAADIGDSKIVAHEFGHLLGFDEGYFRGFRNLGREGIEVREASPYPEDIMSKQESGRVLRAHFERLFRALDARDRANR
jgi:hypothetical protein